MMKKVLSVCLLVLTGSLFAQQGPVPKGVPPLNHVFVIMMENHGYAQIMGNPNAPFINSYAESANLATNYFAVAHPSLTNYLEVVGGSNFGVLDDNSPDWHNASCLPNLASGIVNTEADSSPICPIAGSGTEAATPALDCTNEVHGPPCDINIDGVMSYPASTTTLGITIADQLAAANRRWKTYQEDLPPTGPDTVNYSDGNFTNNSTFAPCPGCNPQLSTSDIVQLYAAKHNPFVYFQNVQQGTNPLVSYAQMSGFDGAGGLWWDLSQGNSPALSFIAPNQCNDQHGRGNGTAFCQYDPNDDGTQNGLNPALITMGDQTVQKIVNSIHGSPVWKRGGRCAIVVVWDENDYSVQPVTNQVVTIVDTNYGFHKLQSNVFYDHFSLLRTLEGGFHLPCLNHACDSSTQVMADLFGER